MNKPNKRDTLNLIFSAFLILGYIVCTYFFLTMSATVPAMEPYINALVFAVFGLVIFYATRVGEGKAVKRFSLSTLLILDVPALYVILAQLIPAMPLHTQIANLGGLTSLAYSPLFILACVALGYGLPYTFFSGYEITESTASNEDECDCCECGCCHDEEEGMFFLCDKDTENALLVVDDMDLEFNPETEIKLSDVTPCDGEVKVGAYVVYAALYSEEELEVLDEDEITEEEE